MFPWYPIGAARFYSALKVSGKGFDDRIWVLGNKVRDKDLIFCHCSHAPKSPARPVELSTNRFGAFLKKRKYWNKISKQHIQKITHGGTTCTRSPPSPPPPCQRHHAAQLPSWIPLGNLVIKAWCQQHYIQRPGASLQREPHSCHQQYARHVARPVPALSFIE